MISFNVFIVIPTYNERRNIENLISNVERIGLELNADFSLLIIDDSSPDGTSKVIVDLQRNYSNIDLVVRQKKKGLASAYKEGFKRALAAGADIVIQIDADLSHDPSYIIPMIKFIPEYDLVVGSRYVPSGGVANWSLLRFSLSRIANFFSKILLRVPISDLTSGFKIIKKEVLAAVEFNTIKSKGYTFQMELILRAYDKGFSIKEYPIIFKGREKEKSKFSFSIVLEALLRVILFFIVRLRKRK